ncbi:MAG: four-helix bundle copper-binding protein [Zetaproteobacteria bacterium]|nr:four-helix bundle copper-binding protein [Zetaproteobacteria bacterium]
MRDDSKDLFSQERRDVLIGAGAVGIGALATTALATTQAFAADSMMMAGEMHHHHAAAAQPQLKALQLALHQCVAASESCIDHCLEMFKSGDVSLADCAISVQETMAFCTAHAKLAAYNSPFLKAMSELGLQVCEACEKQCRKHEKHAECKACADACLDCIKACKTYLSA